MTRQTGDKPPTTLPSPRQARKSELILLWPKHADVDNAQQNEQRAPPHRCMQLRERGRGRMAPFEQAAAEDQHTVNQKQHADEEPYRNDFVFFAHSQFSLTFANPFVLPSEARNLLLLQRKKL